MFFSCINICLVRRSCLNTRPLGRMFKHLLRNPANVNAMKQTCDCYSCTFYLIPTKSPPKTQPKPQIPFFLHWFSQNNMASALNFKHHNACNFFGNKNIDVMISPGSNAFPYNVRQTKKGSALSIVKLELMFEQHVNLMI